MIRRIVLAIAATAGFLNGAFAVEQTPEAFVKAIYDANASFISGKGPSIFSDDKLMKEMLSADLWAAIDDDRQRAAKLNEVPAINGDPFTDSQEPSIKDLQIKTIAVTSTNAEVVASFDRGEPKREEVTFFLIKDGDRWRVNDLGYNRNGETQASLTELLIAD